MNYVHGQHGITARSRSVSLSIFGILILVTLASCNTTGTTPQDPKGRIWKKVSVNGDWFSGRKAHAAVVFDNKLWVIGGNGFRNFNDVWSSSDGESWTEVVTNDVDDVDASRFSRRYNHAAVAFDNKLWVIGGFDSTGPGTNLNDVWSSPDGESWTEVTKDVTSARFSGRSDPAAAVFDDKLWVIGGYDGHSNLDDVWSSSDGESWTEVTKDVTSTRFTGRHEHTAAVLDGKLWVIGGSGDGDLNDVWSSSDGKSWTEVVTNDADAARFSRRRTHAAAVFDGKLWVIGGSGDGDLNDVWSSPDGKSWTEVVTNDADAARFSGRNDHAAAVFNGKLWVIGGNGYTNDVWHSP